MEFHADLHIHSKYSRACSKDCDLEHLAWWAARKGLDVLGTGDFTHPAWREELRTKLVPAEPGLFRLHPETERRIARTLPPSCQRLPRFMLSVEISTIYKRDDRTRKVHHLLYAPTMDAAEAITTDLGRIGNLASDGRPILGLDSRNLLEITLRSDPGSYLVPAHVWTPWFSVLGSKSGFDAIADAYADLADHIFAAETGLSSDPAMNWMVSSLDAYTLVSHSDAHSPPMLGRESSRFETELDYYAIRRALETGSGYRGTVEFFPEEGKYHLDGHRKCGVRLGPEETRSHGGRCPECGGPLTVGVFHRVHELADRPEGYRPPGVADFSNLVPLPEIMSEIMGVGPKSKRVLGEVARLVAALGPELAILHSVPIEEVTSAGGEVLGEAITRLRQGRVIRQAGYDGEYGVIRVFEPGELRSPTALPTLFGDGEIPPGGNGQQRSGSPAARRTRQGGGAGSSTKGSRSGAGERPASSGQARVADTPPPPPADGAPEGRRGLLEGLDPDQRAAAERPGGPLLIIAGPGTGKTRTVTHRIAHLVAERGVAAEECLAITFTRRAAEELQERLTALLGAGARAMTVTTFHGLGALILRDLHERAGLTRGFRVADDAERLEIAVSVTGSESVARRLLARRDTASARRESSSSPGEDAAETLETYEKQLRARDLVDFTDLIALPSRFLTAEPELARSYRSRWRWISVDEYQDIDEAQYTLLRLLTEPDGHITAIGDPDQAIYGFRGADVGFFLRFTEDFPTAETVELTRNYRSAATIVTAATQSIAPTSLVPGRTLRAVGNGPADPVPIGVYRAPDERAEAAFVARAIDRLLGGTSWHSLDSGRVTSDGDGGLAFNDIAVLYRTAAQSEAIVSAFNASGIPFQKRSHDPLLSRPAVRRLAEELPRHPGPMPERVRAAVRALSEYWRADEERLTDLRSAAELVAPLAGRCGDDLTEFLSALATGAEVDALDPRADRVALLTLHAAKGLEFPVVFLVGCEDGLLPFRLPGSDRGEEAEERRLFFVGITRAMRRLYLSHAARRSRHGSQWDRAVSPFLSAIDPGLLADAEEPTSVRRRPAGRQLRLL